MTSLATRLRLPQRALHRERTYAGCNPSDPPRVNVRLPQGAKVTLDRSLVVIQNVVHEKNDHFHPRAPAEPQGRDGTRRAWPDHRDHSATSADRAAGSSAGGGTRVALARSRRAHRHGVRSSDRGTGCLSDRDREPWRPVKTYVDSSVLVAILRA